MSSTTTPGEILSSGFTAEISEVNPVTVEYSLTSHFDAPVARVREAWTTADQLAQWFGPSSREKATVDARPGGHWGLVFEMPDGAEMPLGGSYIEASDDTLVFTTGDPDNTAGDLASLCTVHLVADGDGTRQEFRQAGVHTDPAHAAGARDGWVTFFDQLADLVSARG
ncbi:SRPBCC domain-containing protein [Nocardioides anomalus]|uniref:SRPBCC domain-containing protein n=1 Tax=Nocardioides anomalus TaxID=2712223 RepID=A0A6G6W952_9ACTN|nr:SRPBCC domain-containing protein [Nocardioides anomalus]QIG41677.1 SRPBCC domain-containing protein [Nocardioides anomalus]